MSNNNTPAAPDCYHYRRTSSTFLPVEIVRVSDLDGQLVYFDMDRERITPVQDDGHWRGPVPMPGEPCGECHGTGSVAYGDSGPMECDACHGSGASMFCPHCGEVIA